MKRKKILFLINSLVGGGAERVMSTLLAASEREAEVHDVVLVLLDQEKEAYPAPDHVRVIRLDTGGSLVKSFLQFIALVRQERPDVVVSFLTRSNFVNILSGSLSGHRSVISERAHTSSHYKPGLKGALGKTLVRLLYGRAQAVIAVSQGVADDLRDNFAVLADRLHVIANPIDIGRIRSMAMEAPEPVLEKPFVAAMGRLVKSKNFSLLIDAYAKANLEEDLIIFGQGPERDALQEQVRRLGLGDRVRFLGFSANPFAVVRSAKVFVLPSNGEGFPNGLVEAMALGIPVVSTNCPSGPSEILADLPREAVVGVTAAPFGVLCPQNDPDAMSEALSVLQSDAERERYGRLAAARAESFSVDAARTKYWDVVLSILPN